ncbi:MAG: glutathione S-transferase family protein [Rhizobiaceae bacterium]|nr:glutathione S-transferase family protein [Rhizobiaceae bacterium]
MVGIGIVQLCDVPEPGTQELTYTLHITNKNYTSWSLRPWVLLKTLDIPFTENLVPLPDGPSFELFRTFSPNGRVPCLTHEGRAVWDSLAIIEYLAERHPEIWPRDVDARAWARSACAEMHSSFTALRNDCPMNCGIRVAPHPFSEALRRDLFRLNDLWNDGLNRFGGPFLAGERFTAVDAFFSAVAFRAQTYGLVFEGKAKAYPQLLLDLPAMREWYEAALKETWREENHEADCIAAGAITADLRARA